MPDAIRIRASEVRQRIFEVSGSQSKGAGTLAGQLFHRTLEAALSKSNAAFWRMTLPPDLDAESWSCRLYDRVLGPELTRLRSSLQDSGAETLAVWDGTRSFARWFSGLIREAGRQGAIQYDPHSEQWKGGDNLFNSEVEMAATFYQDGWSQPVAVVGRADHLIRVAHDRWCVIEFKLGAGHPEADAAQVCLYHELQGGSGTAALLHFLSNAEPEEVVFDAEAMMRARPALLNLIGAMAGVTDAKPAPLMVPKALEPESTAWPRRPRESDIELGNRLVRALREYGADAKLSSEPIVGPSFVRYLLTPEKGIPAGKLEKQSSNLQIRLELNGEPFIGRQAGKIVVDLQRADRENVPFGTIIPIPRGARSHESDSRVLVGIDLYGKAHFADLAGQAPHILVGGATFSGKSEWLRCAIASLLANNSASDLRMILIDPKKTAFPDLSESEYLWRAGSFIDTPEEDAVVDILEHLIAELLRRNELLKTERADNITHYMQKTGSVIPRLVCVADEFAELLMSKDKKAARDIEERFIRIAQLGRAAGVHLILATQRPSRQIISGLLKANMPAKVALKVTNRVESSVILDQGGAQCLLGYGDLLFSMGGYDPVRLQSAFISEADRQVLFGQARGAG